MSYCYANGQVIDESSANIPLTNLGVQRGFGIFDLFRARDKKPTFLEDYLDRFGRSQAFLKFDSLISREEIKQAVSDLQQRNGYNSSTFKLMLLADGLDTDEVLKPFFYIINTQIPDQLPNVEATVITHDYLREYPGIKSINYMTSYILHREKKAVNAVDVIYHHNDQVTEASRSNVFIIKDKTLITPSENILLGITRMHVLKMAEDLMDVEVRPVTREEMLKADEVFISSTIKEIMPIVNIDGQLIGSGKMGETTADLQVRFRQYIHNHQKNAVAS